MSPPPKKSHFSLFRLYLGNVSYNYPTLSRLISAQSVCVSSTIISVRGKTFTDRPYSVPEICPLVLTLHSKTFHLVIRSYRLQAIISLLRSCCVSAALCNLSL